MVLKIIIYKGSEILSGILKRQHIKFPLVLKKRHSFADVNEKRERDDGYVTLNAQEHRFNVSPELSGKSGFGI